MLYRKPGRAETFGRRIATVMVAVAGVFPGAESSHADESPLEHCWKQASTRIELQPCLERLLIEAEDRLRAAHTEAVRKAEELDRVTGSRSSNLTHTLESDSRWRGYRRSECRRRAEAMSPGTGSGDVLLACRIDLTNERVKHLEMP